MVDLFATRLNHKLPMYVSPVPDGQAWETDALNISWELLDTYVFCPVALTPSKTSLVGESVDSTFHQQTSQQSGFPESSCLASGVSLQHSGRFSEEVAKRIKEPQRNSSRRIYESRWSIFGKWC